MSHHGQSSAIDFGLPFSAVAADFLLGILDQSGIDRAVFVGQSLGSFVVQHAAAKAPQRVRASVHLGGGSLYPPVTALLKILNPFIHGGIALYPANALYKTFAKHKALKEDTRQYLAQSCAETGKRVISHLTQNMLQDMVRGLAAPSEEPKLLCYGDHEAAFVKRLSRTWHKREPGTTLEVIPDAHHIANQDNPQVFNQTMRSFLETC